MANQQLLDYVKQQLAVGVTKAEIQKAIASQGWSTQDMQEAFVAAEGSPATPAAPATNESHSSKRKWIIIGVTLVVILLLAAGAVLAYPTIQSVLSSTSQPKTPSVATNSTQWITYTFTPTKSSVPGFSFQYPPSFGNPTLEEYGDSLILFFDYGSLQELKATQQEYASSSIAVSYKLRLDIGILPQPKGQTVKQYILSQVPTTTQLTIGGREAYLISAQDQSEQDLSGQGYMLALSTTTALTIGLSGDPKYMTDTDANGNSTRDKIMQSFSFK